MKKEYWIILIAYITMQLSSFIGVPLAVYAGTLLGKTTSEMKILAVPVWLVTSFTFTLLIVLWVLRKDYYSRDGKNKAGIPSSVMWAISGVFLAIMAQTVAANIEAQMGIKTGSENTQAIINIIETFPIVVLVSSDYRPNFRGNYFP